MEMGCFLNIYQIMAFYSRNKMTAVFNRLRKVFNCILLYISLFVIKVKFMYKTRSKFSMLALLFWLISLVNSQISYASLQGFWEATYDTDRDGSATLNDFTDYFKFMEPQHDIGEGQSQPIFNFFDSDNSKTVTLEELIRVANIKVTYNPGHKQIHLGLTSKEGEMQVIWVSNPEHYNEPIVQFGKIPGLLKNTVNGTFHTYNVGKVGGFHGRIYVAIMKDLQPLKRYYYRVGDRQTMTFSKTKYFLAPPLRAQSLDQINIAVFGDMGTFAPFGHFVIDKIAKDHFTKPFNFVFLTGDLAYAGMNNQKRGESAPIWDLFGQLTQKFAAYTAFMPGVGNHQSYYNYTAYFNRYILPKKYPEQTNLYFSFDYGQVHFVHFSSEHSYELGSQQYTFLEDDLRHAKDNPLIEWIVVGVHRAFYSSNLDQYANQTKLCKHLEDLMVKYEVDIVQVGHLHNYERTYPTFKGKPVMDGVNYTHYVNPKAPVYIVQGTAGALIRERFVHPTPAWSATRQQKYGYGRMIIKGNQLRYQFISIPAGRISDEFRIIRSKKAQQSDEMIS